MHIPHGSDWPSRREAGMKADKLGALPGDAASRDGHGYAQEENETVVTLNQQKRLPCWSQNGNGSWAGDFLQRQVFTPHRSRRSFSPYLHRQTRSRNEVTPPVLSRSGRASGAGANRMAGGEGSSQKPMPLGNREDMLTDSRLIGMWSGQVECTSHERVGTTDYV